MNRPHFVPLALLMACAMLPVAGAAQDGADERAVAKVIADWQAAWNAGDSKTYASLLTPDADLASSSGRIARGRDAVIRLYEEQRRGVFAGATAAMRVVQTRFIRPDVVIVDVERELTDLREGPAHPRQPRYSCWSNSRTADG